MLSKIKNFFKKDSPIPENEEFKKEEKTEDGFYKLGLITEYLRASDTELLHRFHGTSTHQKGDHAEKAKMFHELLIRMGNFETCELSKDILKETATYLKQVVGALNGYQEAGETKALEYWTAVAERLGKRLTWARELVLPDAPPLPQSPLPPEPKSNLILPGNMGAKKKLIL